MLDLLGRWAKGWISILWDEGRHKPEGVKTGSEVCSICIGPRVGDVYLEWIMGETMLVYSRAIEHIDFCSLTY